MNIDFSWNPADLVLVAPIILCLLFFVLYWFVAHSNAVKNYFYQKSDFDQAAYQHIFFTKIFGFVAMGLGPLLIIWLLLEPTTHHFGLRYNSETTWFSLVWFLGLSAIIIPLAYKSAKQPQNLINYPQIRSKVWTKKIMFYNVLGWILYLLGYEILFRGILFFPIVEALGVWPAIAINVAMYSATHIPNGLRETIGAIPLAIILCVLTLMSGTIWIAVAVHIVMALTTSLTALKFHPEIQRASA